GGVDAGHVDRRRPFDAKPVVAHGPQVHAARNEVHVRAAIGEARAEVAAKATRAHHRDLHLRKYSAARTAITPMAISASHLAGLPPRGTTPGPRPGRPMCCA